MLDPPEPKVLKQVELEDLPPISINMHADVAKNNIIVSVSNSKGLDTEHCLEDLEDFRA